MSGSLDPTIRGLNDCGCCSGLQAETPKAVMNRPGLAAIAYRVGVHSQFKASMLAQLSTAGATLNLKTRKDDDFSIALIDAWSALLDVLTFYQERIANECYIRTATERGSLLELARLIGYELRPGVSATADVVFTVEDADGAPESVPIEIGTRVQSVPGPNELPQSFETVERIVAHRDWNAMRPRQTRRHLITGTENPFRFQGATTNLKSGDALLITPDGTPDNPSPPGIFRQVATVTPNSADGITEVIPQPPLPAPSPLPRIEREIFFEPGPLVLSLLNLRPERVFNAADLRARGEIFRFRPREVFANLKATQPPPPSVITFRTRAAVFGNNAPTFAALTTDVKSGFGRTNWVDLLRDDGTFDRKRPLDDYPGEPFGSTYLYLDNVYPGIVPGPDSYVLLKDENVTQLFQVQDVAEISKADFTLSLKITRLTLNSNAGLRNLSIRGTTVFAQSESLSLARDPIPEPLTGPIIDLDSYVDGLTAGQRVIVSGESSESRGVQLSESATLAEVTHKIDVDGYTSLVLTNQLANQYVRTSVTIYGNVARTNHGESTSEILGGGDASQKYQAFTLRQPPLTYVSSPAAAGGSTSTLKVFVNDVQWTEVPFLEGQGPSDHVFVTRTGDDGKTILRFGDGVNGARLPTGQENVRAIYRKGIGLSGMVKAGQLSQLMNRPLGVRGVINPRAAEGGEDRESLDAARQNSSLTIMTLDRIVSLEDYENFARAFAGVAKALATWSWSGLVRGVFITVAGPDGAPIDPNGPTYLNLLAAMQRFGDPHVPLRVASYRKALFQVAARLVLASDRTADPQPVLDSAERALRQTFSFTGRAFGQSVALSEVVAVLQSVAGVRAVEVSQLFRDDDQPGLNALLPVVTPQPGPDLNLTAAELLTLDPRPVDLGIAP
jgi:hypothetical protein